MRLKVLLFLLSVTSAFSCNSQERHSCVFLDQPYSDHNQCGFIEVPKNYDDPSKGNIELAYMVIKSKSTNRKPDPVVFIQGGPGGNVLSLARTYRQLNIDDDRDFILYDQRGIGHSNEVCTGLSEQLIEVMAMDLSPEAEFAAIDKRINDCAQNLSRDDAKFSTPVNAKDLEMLRKHLGYEELNLFGGSYGTRLGLEYMRQYPKRVRSAILSGLFAPDTRMYDHLVSDFNRSLKKLFQGCKDDPYCNGSYPSFENDFFELLKHLETTPVTLYLNGEDFTLNPQDFLLIVHQLMYNENTIGAIPKLIKTMTEENYEYLARVTQLILYRISSINLAVYWSVMKADESRFDNAEMFRKDEEKNPALKSGLNLFAIDIDVYQKWPDLNASQSELNAVVSDIPTLLVSGDYDPITPPRNGEEAATHLKNGQHVVFKNAGHVPINPCFFALSKAFLDNPNESLDLNCVKEPSRIYWD